MNTKLLRQKILDLAIRGKLTQQKKSDGTTKDLLRQISSNVILSNAKNPGKSKNTPKEIIPLDKSEAPFEIPTTWEWVRLGDVVINRDAERKPVSKKERNLHSLKIYDYYGAAGVIDKVEEFLFDEPLLLIGEDGANLLSRSKPNALIAEGQYWVNNHAHVIDAFDKSMLFYIALYINAISLDDFVTGTAQPKLNQENLNKIPVPLPPLAEQQRIVTAIENAFAEITEIENNQELLKKHIKQGRQKILDLAIRGKLTQQLKTDGTTKDLLESIMAASSESHPERSAAKSKDPAKKKQTAEPKQIIPLDKTTAPFEIPSTWEWVRLGDIVKQVTDFTASGSFASLRENVKYYKEENYALLVRTVDFRYGFQRDLTYTDKHGYEFLSNSNLFGGELLLSNIGSIGKVFIVPDLDRKMTLAPNSIMVRTFDDNQRNWLYYFFLSPLGQQSLNAISSSTTQAKFNKTDLKGVMIPLPPLAEQQRIVTTIEQSFAEFDAMEVNL